MSSGHDRQPRRPRHAPRGWSAILVAATVFLVAVGSALPAEAGFVQRSRLRWQTGDRMGEAVKGGWARLVREPAGIRTALRTRGLEGGHAYTMWLVVFNDPENCVGRRAGAADAGNCATPDVFSPLAAASHIYGDGKVVGADGLATFSARVRKGHPGLFPAEPGLTDPAGAEVWIVVRDHGPAVEGSDQTTTLNGGCTPVPPGYGSPGTYSCENEQMAVFPSP